MIYWKTTLLLVLVSLVLFACSSGSVAPSNTPGKTNTPVITVGTSPTLTATPSLTETLLTSPTATSTPTNTRTPSPIPTYATLRGTVIVEKASCRYGPGAMYLYLYGLVQGANQDVIGRTDTGKWLLTRSRGDNKACWVNAELMKVSGDVMSVEMVYPDKYHLPPSNQGYLPPWDVAAVRQGNQVVISWKSEALRPGDEESKTSVLYVVETWVCQGGQLVFIPLGAYGPQASVTDEPGCDQPSHGRVFFSEKHGYAGPSEIPWPAAQASTPTP